MRSSDRGTSWDESTLEEIMDLSTDPVLAQEQWLEDLAQSPVDFTNPETLVMSGGLPGLFTPRSRAWLRLSSDAGRTWRPPVILPMAGLGSLCGHGNACVRPDGMALIGMTTVNAEGWDRRPLVYASPDGRSWSFLSFITAFPDDGAAVSDKRGSPRFGPQRYQYPRLIQLADGRVLASLRSQRDPTGILWTEVHHSNDGGRTWAFLSRVNDWGAPGDIIQLQDGRVLCVYGYRLAPSGVRYRVSEDGGRTWGSEWILRDDGGNWDLGYPRVVELERNRCLAVYYMNTREEMDRRGFAVRHIAGTFFDID
jgi:hypothetical protein